MSERVARSRELVAAGHRPAVVARILQISRQAIYRVPALRPASARRRSGPPADEVEAAIVEVAEANQTDGYRMVAALVARKLGRAVNRKRVLRVMRQRRLIQRRRRLDRRRRPGFFRVTRPNELWHLDMTSVERLTGKVAGAHGTRVAADLVIAVRHQENRVPLWIIVPARLRLRLPR